VHAEYGAVMAIPVACLVSTSLLLPAFKIFAVILFGKFNTLFSGNKKCTLAFFHL